MGTGSERHHPGILVLLPIFFVPFILYGVGILNAPLFLGSLLVVLFLLVLLIRFEVGFLIIIVMRSSLDYLKNFTASDFNVAAAVSIALIVLGVFYILLHKADIFQFDETIFFLFFLAATGVSVFYSRDLMGSFSDWLRLVSVFSVYLLARIIFVDRGQVRSAFTAVLLSSLIPLAVACVQYITGRGLVLDGTQARIVGTFLHPNAFASYLLILLVFGVSQWFEKEKIVSPFFLRILISLIFVIFIFTFSRGGWLALVVSMIFLGAVRYRKLLVFFPLVLLLVVVSVPATMDRIENTFNPGYTHGRSAWAWRQDTWKEILPLVYEKPFLGHGLATVEAELGVMTHNDYLRLLAETGMVGLIAYLLLMLSLLIGIFRDFRRTRSELVRGLQVGLMAMIVGFLFRQFADNTLRNTVVMIYFWLLAALIRTMGRLSLRPGFDKKFQPVESKPVEGQRPFPEF